MSNSPLPPADGWYFMHQSSKPASRKAVYHRVVMWQKTSNDDKAIIGLISAHGNGDNDSGTPNRLVPPPASGMYIHWDEMNDYDRKAALGQVRMHYMDAENT